ncbi:MAG: tRNA 2-thiouridine(34) synthase MnmA [Synergistetes bacterium]|nr:tRNA 2-thiouridine(34) synthase MnmA [Synergistota bacterium]MCX8128125.1 tRNA 2-thiouridine(34) synthase MnmA [Synergistota bacterium]MDW8192501.1 tRNA 2-thiouridine(34) synthase MnmA [Synergistota bacterium]
MTEKVVIGLSGGVDSAVSAFLLKEQGYDVVGVNFILSENHSSEKARKIASRLGINLLEIDLTSLFKTEVIDYFLGEYLEGRTPNPCAICNRRIKFLKLWELAESLGASYIATGHYAIVKRFPFGLFKGKDPKKDQSYFLSLVDRELLEKAIFPLGEKTREWVLKKAQDLGIADIISPRGSQDICFIEGNFREFIKDKLKDKLKKGVIRDISGKILGEHEGIALYTIGQRRRLGVATGIRQYIIALNAERNEVVLGALEELFKSEFKVKQVNWLSEEKEVKGDVKIRYHTPPSKALAVPVQDGRVKVVLEEPITAVTPGQVATFYSGNQVIWGGIIEE